MDQVYLGHRTYQKADIVSGPGTLFATFLDEVFGAGEGPEGLPGSTSPPWDC